MYKEKKMIDEVIIHIGDHKAGSTSIQMAFHKQHVISPDLFYPDAHPDAKVPHNHNWYGRSTGQDYENVVMDHLKEQILNSGKSKAVISTAWYAYLNPKELSDHINKHYRPIAKKVTVVRYLRPPLDYCRSVYVEMIKIAEENVDFRTFFKNSSYKLPKYYDSIIEHHKQDYDIITRPFVKEALYKGDVVDDFLHICAGDDYEISKREISNPASCIQHLAIMKYFHERLEDRNFDQVRDDGYFIWQALEQYFPIEDPIYFMMPEDIVNEVRFDPIYIEDARKTDELISNGHTYLQDSLRDSITKSVPYDMNLDIEDWYSRDIIALIKTFARFYMISENRKLSSF